MKFVSHRLSILKCKGLNSPVREMSWNSHYRNGLSSHLIDIIRALHGIVVPDNSAALRSNPHRYRCMSKWFTPHQVFHPSCQLSTISSVTTACKIAIPITRLQLLKSGIPRRPLHMSYWMKKIWRCCGQLSNWYETQKLRVLCLNFMFSREICIGILIRNRTKIFGVWTRTKCSQYRRSVV